MPHQDGQTTPEGKSVLKGAIIPVTPFQQNCLLLWDEATKRGVVVDPGGDVPRIRAAIEQAGVTVERILLTHGHIDHAGGAADLREALGVPLEGPDERDRVLLQGMAAQARMFGFGARDVLPDRWLKEGDQIALGDHRLDVLHCPGHTPGHVAYVNRAARFAIVGDVLFQGSIGRTDLPFGDHAALLRSITDKLLTLPDDFAVLSGHGSATTIGAERDENPFLR
jgi:glyoxylase-like metal-dependent hydrolase (beta-lactamase superfamily II)